MEEFVFILKFVIGYVIGLVLMTFFSARVRGVKNSKDLIRLMLIKLIALTPVVAIILLGAVINSMMFLALPIGILVLVFESKMIKKHVKFEFESPILFAIVSSFVGLIAGYFVIRILVNLL